ncbi:MAG TPA: OsmC family protein [Burkholderiales bacterium]|nr:OsmC family protein [Burkholderiales bacterium]
MEGGFSIELEEIENYLFDVDFGNSKLIVDEPPPLGEGKGPNASRLLTAAVADCLSASLLFCLRKFKNKVDGMKTAARTNLVRNDKGRLRIGSIEVTIRLAENYDHLDRCLSQFEDFCVVTASVRQGIPVKVQVLDPEGNVLHES